jgi:hypothetical protein
MRDMDNMGKTTSETESGAKKVGTYDIPDDGSSDTLPTAVEPRRGLSWLWWLLGLLILLAVLAWAFNSFMAGTGPTDVPAATATPVAAVINLVARVDSAAA